MNLENFKVVEISQDEENATNGGLLLYSGWYYLCYGIGYVAHGINNAIISGGNAMPSGIGRGTY